ncbi:hypothetical protein OQI_20720 [Streptomyces pharetrae CZA14]|uniref:Uncharacterized protein n=1 Tax=Streptomyces pharetrae CZA14 TaxID=1144883 RepID=A0ABX3YGF5_9ACTN|nr:hypothetical protein OQI_20720 [Streptomyces pharetrae CZA14]
MEQPRTALAERIAERRVGVGDPRALVGEMRRSILLVPVSDGHAACMRRSSVADRIPQSAPPPGRGTAV